MTMQISGNWRPPSGQDSGLRSDLILLARVLLARRDGLAEAMTDRFLSEGAKYHHTVPERARIQTAYGAHLDAVLRASELPVPEQAPAVRAVATDFGRTAASGGEPLAIQMEFYRLGLRVLWEAVVQDGGEGVRPEVVWRLQDTWVQNMTAAYHRESREAIRWRER